MAHDDTPRTVLKSVAGWTLGQTLGKGGFGHVRKATHPGGRQAAVKILPALRHDTIMSKDMMLDALEAHKEVVILKMMGGLGVTGVVGLDMVREDGNWKYLFLPMMPKSGTDLSYRMPESDFIPLIRGLLCSLHVMHRLGFSHEDLKPANCLVDAQGRLILADFGFATFSPHGSRMAASGGTLHYSSPEKVANKRYYGPMSDVWAVGVLMCKWLANYNPFLKLDNDSDEAIEDRITHGRARHSIPDEGPHSVGHLIRMMLQLDPKQRWTIPEVLAHPYLNPPAGPSNRPVHRLPLESPILPKQCYDAVPNPDPVILLEVLFLAMTAGEWFPVQTDQKIRERLARSEQQSTCWEKNAYHALRSWKEKDPDQSGSPGPKGLMVKPKMKPLSKVLGELDLNSPKHKIKQQQSNKINEFFKMAKASSPQSPTKLAKQAIKPVTEPEWQDEEDEDYEKGDDSICEVTREQAAAAMIQAARRTEIFVDMVKTAPKAVVKSKPPVLVVSQPPDQAAIQANKPKKATLKTPLTPRKVSAVRKPSRVVETAATKQKKAGQDAGTAPRVTAAQTKKLVKALSEQEFLPAPLPHVRRRSPRLMGLQPETDGLSYEPRARRSSPLMS